jgi:acetyl esterase/lipase
VTGNCDSQIEKELSKPPFLGSELANEADVPAARQWLEDVVMNLPRGPPATAFRRPVAELKIENAIVMYSEDQSFRIRIYSPTSPNQGKRPALVLYHGGGWVHGYPEVDEGTVSIYIRSCLSYILLSSSFSTFEKYWPRLRTL